MITEEQARAVKQRHSDRLRQMHGVSGVGIEKNAAGEFVLSVHLDAQDPNAGKEVPQAIEGLPVRLIRSGPFQKF